MNKSIYEEKIRNNQIFNYEAGSTAFNVERSKLQADLFNYLLETYGEQYQGYGLEVVNAVESCIKYYRSEKGPFMNYLIKIVFNEIEHSDNCETQDIIMRGASVSREESKFIKNYRDYVKLYEKYSDGDKPDIDRSASYLSKEFNYDYDKAVEGIKRFESFSFDTPLIVGDGDEEEYNEAVAYVKSDVNIESIFEDKEAIVGLFDRIEKAFDVQRQSKDLIAVYITNAISESLNESGCLDIAKNRNFFNSDIYNSYLKSRHILTKREIGVMFSKSEQSVNRTIKEFLKKVER